MKRLLCIKSVYREDCGGECFTEGLTYEIFDIDTDYFNNTDIWLEALNDRGRSHIIACIKGDVCAVKDEDWLQDEFFREHFKFCCEDSDLSLKMEPNDKYKIKVKIGKIQKVMPKL